MNYRTTGSSILAFLLLVLAGCFSLSRDTPVLHQYVLGGGPVAVSADMSPEPVGQTIGLRRLDLAPYLAAPAVVVRRGQHQIVLSEYHRWVEDPAEGINRAVAAYLAAAGPYRAVDVAPWTVQSRYDYLIQLHISRFEGLAPEDSMATEGGVRVVASWEILNQQNGIVHARGTTDYQETGWRVGDYSALVVLLDRGLNDLAQDLAACLATLATASARLGDDVRPADTSAAIQCGP
jgi:uncharacterized lipoprotein YmbA